MNTEQVIELMHTLFIVFLVLTIILILTAVALFFLLDIKEVFNFITGRAVRKTVQEMEKANNATGRLRKVNKMAMGEMAPMFPEEDEKSIETEKLQQTAQESAESESTTLLNDGTQDTTLLNANETSVLSSELDTVSYERSDSVKIGRFEIIHNILLVHTSEVI